VVSNGSQDAPAEKMQVFVVSDGTGDTASALARAAMLQFQVAWELRAFVAIRHPSQVPRVVDLAERAGALVVFTLVDKQVARALREQAEERGVPAVDLLGGLLSKISESLRAEPRHLPGLLHGFSDDYFRRVEAVEFAVRHDDGANVHTLFQADIVITGVSRTSKTPLSMHLAQRGYKTGNVPIIPNLEPPRELLELDSRKVFGLVVNPDTLLEIRRARVRALRAGPYHAYADPEGIVQELQRARRLFRAQGWRTVNISGKAVEENAARIVELTRASWGRARNAGT
jgi:regulator of PEP synthase PpsR (kinase-PPPase family)